MIDGHRAVLHDYTGEHDHPTATGPYLRTGSGFVVNPPMTGVRSDRSESLNHRAVDRSLHTATGRCRNEELDKNENRNDELHWIFSPTRRNSQYRLT